jgi:phospholipase/lecithinase/hemolysin
VKKLLRFAAGIVLFGFFVLPAQAAFSSIYIFGDGVSTTTSNIVSFPLSTNYYGYRSCNGRAWVELLAQEQGLTNNYWYSANSSNHFSYTNLSASSTNWSYSSNNWSYYGDYSALLVTNLNKFIAPADASNDLFVVWINDADFVGDINNNNIGYIGNSSHGTNLTAWTNANNQSLTNHFNIITNLYAKGVRTLIMPNAVDITEVPYYVGNPAAYKNFVRQRVIDFNTAFGVMLTNATTLFLGLKIYEPDIFSLLDNMLTNSAYYGLTNPGIDALQDTSLKNTSMNGPGANYVFWDYLNPTAKAQAQMADLAQQLLSPPQISKLTSLTNSNQLDTANIPVGRNGFVESSTNLVNWTFNTNISSTNVTESILIPTSGPVEFYRLNFPFVWSWP